MKEHVQLNIGGIQCDKEGCDYVDASVKVEDYPEWLNKPCPKCSSNLLTQADFDNIQFLLATTKIINSMSPEELLALGVNIEEGNNKGANMKVEMDGTGKMDFDLTFINVKNNFTI